MEGDPDTDTDIPSDLTEEVLECTVDGNCDDDDPCTTDACESGSCLHSLVDADGDGFPASEVDGTSCDGTDCDDSEPSIHPGADEEPCSGRDEDCDGVMSTVEDADGDGHPNADCAPDGIEPDCDDSDDSIYPGAPLQCDGLDHDCSGHPDQDEDGDGHYNEDLCDDGYDCDDTRADVYPGAPEVCMDGIDQDCDGIVDGPILLDSPTAVDSNAGSFRNGKLIWTGSQFGLVYGYGRFVRIDAPGGVLGEILYFSSNCDNQKTDVTWTGSEFVFVSSWAADPEWPWCAMYLHRMSADGEIVAEDVQLTEEGSSTSPTIAWNGEYLGFVTPEVNFKLIDVTGADRSGEIDLSVASGYSGMSYFGDRFFLIDILGSKIQIALVNSTPAQIPTPDDFYRDEDATILSERMGMAWSGSRLGLAWYSFHEGGGYSAFFTESGNNGVRVGDVTELSDSPNTVDPQVTWIGEEYAVAWVEHSSFTDYSMHFNRVGTDPYDPGAAVEIHNSVPYHLHLFDITWTGSELAVVYDEEGESTRYSLYFQRLSLCD